MRRVAVFGAGVLAGIGLAYLVVRAAADDQRAASMRGVTPL